MNRFWFLVKYNIKLEFRFFRKDLLLCTPTSSVAKSANCRTDVYTVECGAVGWEKKNKVYKMPPNPSPNTDSQYLFPCTHLQSASSIKHNHNTLKISNYFIKKYIKNSKPG